MALVFLQMGTLDSALGPIPFFELFSKALSELRTFFQEANYGHCEDERQADGYCTGGNANNDRCSDRQLKHERHVYGGDSSDEEEESLEVMVNNSVMSQSPLSKTLHIPR